jgi:hypothetical protein
VAQAMGQLEQELGRNATETEVAERLGIAVVGKCRQALHRHTHPLFAVEASGGERRAAAGQFNVFRFWRGNAAGQQAVSVNAFNCAHFRMFILRGEFNQQGSRSPEATVENLFVTVSR